MLMKAPRQNPLMFSNCTYYCRSAAFFKFKIIYNGSFPLSYWFENFSKVLKPAQNHKKG